MNDLDQHLKYLVAIRYARRQPLRTWLRGLRNRLEWRWLMLTGQCP